MASMYDYIKEGGKDAAAAVAVTILNAENALSRSPSFPPESATDSFWRPISPPPHCNTSNIGGERTAAAVKYER